MSSQVLDRPPKGSTAEGSPARVDEHERPVARGDRRDAELQAGGGNAAPAGPADASPATATFRTTSRP